MSNEQIGGAGPDGLAAANTSNYLIWKQYTTSQTGIAATFSLGVSDPWMIEAFSIHN
jgi:hypothetical protein